MGAGESVVRGELDPRPFVEDAKEYCTRGHWLQARKAYLTALEATIARDGEESIGEGRIRAAMGDMFLRQRLFPDAMREFQATQNIFDKCRKNKESEKPTVDEYKAVLNNLAFSQYNCAQSKKRGSKEFVELNQSALNKWKIVAQMKVGGQHDSNIAETLTFMSCIHMQQNNLGEARKLLTKTGEIQTKQGAPRNGTRRLYKSVTSAMAFTNAACLIQRVIKRKLKWIRFRRLLQLQREAMEEEERLVRDTIYTFEDDCSDAWVILFFNCSSYVWSKDTRRVEIIREMLVQVVNKQEVIIEELFDEEENFFKNLYTNFVAEKQWIEDKPQREERQWGDLLSREEAERDNLAENYADVTAQLLDAMREDAIRAKEAEHDRIHRAFRQCSDEEEYLREEIRDDEGVEWSKLWKDYMAGKMKIMGERLAKMESQRQDVIKEEEDARKKISPEEHDFRAELLQREEEERRRLKAWLEARTRAIKELSREEEEARRHIRNRAKDISGPWEAMFAEGLAAAKAKEEARLLEEERQRVALRAKVEREEIKARSAIEAEQDAAWQDILALNAKLLPEALKAEEAGNKRRAVLSRKTEAQEKRAEIVAEKEVQKQAIQRKREEEKKEVGIAKIVDDVQAQMRKAARRGSIAEETDTDSDQEDLVEGAPDVVVVTNPDGSKGLKRVKKVLKLTDDERARLKKHFDAIDTNGSGDIDKDEFFVFYNAVMKEKLKKPETDEIFDRLDVDKGGSLEFEEFVKAYKTLTDIENAKAAKDFAAAGRVKALQAKMTNKLALVRTRKTEAAETKKELEAAEEETLQKNRLKVRSKSFVAAAVEPTPMFGDFVLSDDPQYKSLADRLAKLLREDPIGNVTQIAEVQEQLAKRAAELGKLSAAEQQALHEAALKREKEADTDEGLREFRFTDDPLYRDLFGQLVNLLSDEPQHHAKQIADLTARLQKRAEELKRLSEAEQRRLVKESVEQENAMLEAGVDPLTLQPIETAPAVKGDAALIHDDPFKDMVNQYREAVSKGAKPAVLAEMREDMKMRAKKVKPVPTTTTRHFVASSAATVLPVVGASTFVPTDDSKSREIIQRAKHLIAEDPVANKAAIDEALAAVADKANELAVLPDTMRRRAVRERKRERAMKVARGMDPDSGAALDSNTADVNSLNAPFTLMDSPAYRLAAKTLDDVFNSPAPDMQAAQIALEDLQAVAAGLAGLSDAAKRKMHEDAVGVPLKLAQARVVANLLDEVGDVGAARLLLGPVEHRYTDDPAYKQLHDRSAELLAAEDAPSHAAEIADLTTQMQQRAGVIDGLAPEVKAQQVEDRKRRIATLIAQGKDPVTGLPLQTMAPEERHSDVCGPIGFVLTDDDEYRKLWLESKALEKADPNANDARVQALQKLMEQRAAPLLALPVGDKARLAQQRKQRVAAAKAQGVDPDTGKPLADAQRADKPFELTDEPAFKALYTEYTGVLAEDPTGRSPRLNDLHEQMKGAARAALALPDAEKKKLAAASAQNAKDEAARIARELKAKGVDPATGAVNQPFKLTDDPGYNGLHDEYHRMLAEDPRVSPARVEELRDEMLRRSERLAADLTPEAKKETHDAALKRRAAALRDNIVEAFVPERNSPMKVALEDLPSTIKRKVGNKAGKVAALNSGKSAATSGLAADGDLLGPAGFLLTDDDAYRALFDKHHDMVKTDPAGNKALLDAIEDKLRNRAAELSQLPEDELARKAFVRRQHRAALASTGVDPVTGLQFADLHNPHPGTLYDDASCRHILEEIVSLVSVDPVTNKAALIDLRSALVDASKPVAADVGVPLTRVDDVVNAAVRVGDALGEGDDEIVRGPAIPLATDDAKYGKIATKLLTELAKPTVTDRSAALGGIFDELMDRTAQLKKDVDLKGMAASAPPVADRAAARVAMLAQGIDPDTGKSLAGADTPASSGAWRPTDDPTYKNLFSQLRARVEAGVTAPDATLINQMVRRARELEERPADQLSALGEIGAKHQGAATRWNVREGLLGKETGGILGHPFFVLTDDPVFKQLHAELGELLATNPRGNARAMEAQEQKLRARAAELRNVPGEAKQRLAWARMVKHAEDVAKGIDPFTGKPVDPAAQPATFDAKDFRLTDDVTFKEKFDDYLDRIALDPSENAPARVAMLTEMQELAREWAVKKDADGAKVLAMQAAADFALKKRTDRILATLRNNHDHIVFGDSQLATTDDAIMEDLADQLRSLVLNPNVDDAASVTEAALDIHSRAAVRQLDIQAMSEDQRMVLRQQRRERKARQLALGQFQQLHLNGSRLGDPPTPMDDPRYADAVEEYLGLLNTPHDLDKAALEAGLNKVLGIAAALAKVPLGQRQEASARARNAEMAESQAAVKRALLQRCGECGVLGPAYFQPSDDTDFAALLREALQLVVADPTANATAIEERISKMQKRMADIDKWPSEKRRLAADDRRRRHATLVSQGIDPFSGKDLRQVVDPASVGPDGSGTPASPPRDFMLSDDVQYRDLLDHFTSLLNGDVREATKPLAAAISAMQQRQQDIKKNASKAQLEAAAVEGRLADAKLLVDRIDTTAERANRDTLVLGPRYFVPTDDADYSRVAKEMTRLLTLDANGNNAAVNDLIGPLSERASELASQGAAVKEQLVQQRRRQRVALLAAGYEATNGVDLKQLHADAPALVNSAVADAEFNGWLVSLGLEVQENSGRLNTDSIFDHVVALGQRAADLARMDAATKQTTLAMGHSARKEAIQSIVYRALIPAELDSLMGPSYFVPTDDPEFKKLHDESKRLTETEPGSGNDGRVKELAALMGQRAATLATLPEMDKRRMANARRARNADLLRKGIDPASGRPFATLLAKRGFKLTDDPEYDKVFTAYHELVQSSPAKAKEVADAHEDMKRRASAFAKTDESTKRQFAKLGVLRAANKKMTAAATTAKVQMEPTVADFSPADDEEYKKMADDAMELLMQDPVGNDAAVQALEAKMQAKQASLMELPEECKQRRAEARRQRMINNLARGLDPYSGRPLGTDGGFKNTDDPEYMEKLQASLAALQTDPSAALAQFQDLAKRSAVLGDLTEDQKKAKAALRAVRKPAATRTRQFILTDDVEYADLLDELNRLMTEDPKKHAVRIAELNELIRKRAKALQGMSPEEKDRVANEAAQRDLERKKLQGQRRAIVAGDSGMGPNGEDLGLLRGRMRYGALEHDDAFLDWASREEQARQAALLAKKSNNKEDEGAKVREEKDKLKAERERQRQEEMAKAKSKVEAAKEAQRKKQEILEKEKAAKAAAAAKLKEAEAQALANKKAKEEAEAMKRRQLIARKRGGGAADDDDDGLTEADRALLREHFDKVDVDKSGQIDREEFCQFYSEVMQSNLSKKELYEIFDKLDSDGGGSLDFEEFAKVYKIMLEMEAAKKDPTGALRMKELENQLKRKQAAAGKNAFTRAALKARAFGRRASFDDVLDDLDRDFVMEDDLIYKDLTLELEEVLADNHGAAGLAAADAIQAKLTARAAILAELPEDEKQRLARIGARRDAAIAIEAARRTLMPIVGNDFINKYIANRELLMRDPVAGQRQSDELVLQMRALAPQVLEEIGGTQVLPDDPAELGYLQDLDAKKDRAFMLTDDDDYLALFLDYHKLARRNPDAFADELADLAAKMRARAAVLTRLSVPDKKAKMEAAKKRNAKMSRRLRPEDDKEYVASMRELEKLKRESFPPPDRIKELESYCGEVAQKLKAPYKGALRGGGIKDDYVGGLGGSAEDKKKRESFPRRPFRYTDDEEYRGLFEEYKAAVRKDPVSNAARIKELNKLMAARAAAIDKMKQDEKDRMRDIELQRQEDLARRRIEHDRNRTREQAMARQPTKKNLKQKDEEDAEAIKKRMAEEELAKKRQAVEAAKLAKEANKNKLEAEKAAAAAALAKAKEEEAEAKAAKKRAEEAEAFKKRVAVRARRGGVGEEDDHGLTEADLALLREHFDKVDVDKSGQIDREEFCQFYNNVMKSNLSKKELYEIFDKLDADGGGSLDFEEFAKVYKLMLEMETAKKDPTGNRLKGTVDLLQKKLALEKARRDEAKKLKEELQIEKDAAEQRKKEELDFKRAAQRALRAARGLAVDEDDEEGTLETGKSFSRRKSLAGRSFSRRRSSVGRGLLRNDDDDGDGSEASPGGSRHNSRRGSRMGSRRMSRAGSMAGSPHETNVSSHEAGSPTFGDFKAFGENHESGSDDEPVQDEIEKRPFQLTDDPHYKRVLRKLQGLVRRAAAPAEIKAAEAELAARAAELEKLSSADKEELAAEGARMDAKDKLVEAAAVVAKETEAPFMATADEECLDMLQELLKALEDPTANAARIDDLLQRLSRAGTALKSLDETSKQRLMLKACSRSATKMAEGVDPSTGDSTEISVAPFSIAQVDAFRETANQLRDIIGHAPLDGRQLDAQIEAAAALARDLKPHTEEERVLHTLEAAKTYQHRLEIEVLQALKQVEAGPLGAPPGADDDEEYRGLADQATALLRADPAANKAAVLLIAKKMAKRAAEVNAMPDKKPLLIARRQRAADLISRGLDPITAKPLGDQKGAKFDLDDDAAFNAALADFRAAALKGDDAKTASAVDAMSARAQAFKTAAPMQRVLLTKKALAQRKLRSDEVMKPVCDALSDEVLGPKTFIGLDDDDLKMLVFDLEDALTDGATASKVELVRKAIAKRAAEVAAMPEAEKQRLAERRRANRRQMVCNGMNPLDPDGGLTRLATLEFQAADDDEFKNALDALIERCSKEPENIDAIRGLLETVKGRAAELKAMSKAEKEAAAMSAVQGALAARRKREVKLADADEEYEAQSKEILRLRRRAPLEAQAQIDTLQANLAKKAVLVARSVKARMRSERPPGWDEEDDDAERHSKRGVVLPVFTAPRREFEMTDDPEYKGYYTEFTKLTTADPVANKARLEQLQQLMAKRAEVLRKLTPEQQQDLLATGLATESAAARDTVVNHDAKKVLARRARTKSVVNFGVEVVESDDDDIDADAIKMRQDLEAAKRDASRAEDVRRLEALLAKRDKDLKDMKDANAKRKEAAAGGRSAAEKAKQAALEAMAEAERKKQEKAAKARELKAAQIKAAKEKQQAEVAAAKKRQEADIIKRKMQVKQIHGDDDDTLGEAELALLREHFDKVDVDKSGQIDREEFCQFYNNVMKSNLSKKELYEIFDKLDTDGGGSLDFEEFAKVYKIMLEMEAAKKDPNAVAKMKAVTDKLRARQAASLRIKKDSEALIAKLHKGGDSDASPKLLQRGAGRSFAQRQKIEDSDDDAEDESAKKTDLQKPAVLAAARAFNRRRSSVSSAKSDDTADQADDDWIMFEAAGPSAMPAFRSIADELAFVVARDPGATEHIEALKKKLLERSAEFNALPEEKRTELTNGFKDRLRKVRGATYSSSEEDDALDEHDKPIAGVTVPRRVARDPLHRFIAGERERAKAAGRGVAPVKQLTDMMRARAAEVRKEKRGPRTGARPHLGDRRGSDSANGVIKRTYSSGRMRFGVDPPNDPYDHSRGEAAKKGSGPRWGFGKIADEPYKYLSDAYEQESKKGGSDPAHLQRLKYLEDMMKLREEQLQKQRAARGPFRNTDDTEYATLLAEYSRLLKDPAGNAARISALEKQMAARHAVLSRLSDDEKEAYVARAMAREAADEAMRNSKYGRHRYSLGNDADEDDEDGHRGPLTAVRSTLRGRTLLKRAANAFSSDSQYTAWYDEAEKIRKDPQGNQERLRWLEAQMKKRAEELEAMRQEEENYAKQIADAKDEETMKKRMAVEAMKREKEARKDKQEAEKAAKAAAIAKAKEDEEKAREAKKIKENADAVKRKMLVRAKRGGGDDDLDEEDLARIRDAFNQVDVNRTGAIDKDQFCQFYNTLMQEKLPKKDLYALFEKLDADGGGSLDFDEFTKVYKIMFEMEIAKKEGGGARLRELEAKLMGKRDAGAAVAVKKSLANLKARALAKQPTAPAGDGPSTDQQRIGSMRVGSMANMRARRRTVVVDEEDEDEPTLGRVGSLARRRSSVQSVDSHNSDEPSGENASEGKLSRTGSLRNRSRRDSNASGASDDDSGSNSRSQSFRGDGSESESDDDGTRLARGASTRRAARLARARTQDVKQEDAARDREEKKRLKEQREAEKQAEIDARREQVKKQKEESKAKLTLRGAVNNVRARMNFTGEEGDDALVPQSSGSLLRKNTLTRRRSVASSLGRGDSGMLRTESSVGKNSSSSDEGGNKSGSGSDDEDAQLVDGDVNFSRASAARLRRAPANAAGPVATAPSSNRLQRARRDMGSDSDEEETNTKGDDLHKVTSVAGAASALVRRVARKPAGNTGDDEKQRLAAQLREEEKARREEREKAKEQLIAERREKLRLEREARAQRTGAGAATALRPAPPAGPSTGRPTNQ